MGNDFRINTYTTGRQFNSAVSRSANGSFVVVWDSPGSYGTDNSGSSIQGRRYSNGVLFSDGFESGDTSAWSSTVPSAGSGSDSPASRLSIRSRSRQVGKKRPGLKVPSQLRRSPVAQCHKRKENCWVRVPAASPFHELKQFQVFTQSV